MRKFSEKKISCEKLSRLQRLILVALCDPQGVAMKRQAFNRTLKRLWWGNTGHYATSSLSRALQRLEERGYIVGSHGRWMLTSEPPHDNGVVLAFLAWAREREFYAGLGLKGPPRDALEAAGVIAAKPPARPGVRVELDTSML